MSLANAPTTSRSPYVFDEPTSAYSKPTSGLGNTASAVRATSSQTHHGIKPIISERRLINPAVNDVDIADNVGYIFP
jgi:hypothetical protein